MLRAARVAESDERSTTEVRDEEGDLARPQCLAQMSAKHIGGGESPSLALNRELTSVVSIEAEKSARVAPDSTSVLP